MRFKHEINPRDYHHPHSYDGKSRNKQIKDDKEFIDRQMKVPGSKCEIGAFYFIYNDPRTQWK